MKKILLGILVIAALSACSSSEEKMDIPTQVQNLNKAVKINTQALMDIKSQNENVKSQLEIGQKETAIIAAHMKMVKAFEGTGVVVTKIDGKLHLSLPGDSTFKSSESILNKNIKTILDPISETLINYLGTNAMIKGYTDSTGSKEFNQTLSVDRATIVSDYLINQGVESSRIETVGVGSSDPIDDNNTETGKALNRRIDITISY
uniref:OmpA-like domain-containing protein n=1 Tax=Hirondellea gigas TaxID=1518452 RepID=A0A6A7G4S1_9CRUS